MLMGGGLALGYAIQASELLDIVAGEIAGALGGASVWLIMLVFSALVLSVGTFISHTVSAIVILPVSAPPSPLLRSAALTKSRLLQRSAGIYLRTTRGSWCLPA